VILLETTRGRDPLGVLLRILGALALLLAVALLALLVLFAANFAGVGRAGEDFSNRARGAIESTSAVVQRTVQGVTDRFDPAHPPRDTLAYDAEFAELLLVPSGGVIAEGPAHALILVDGRLRPDAATPNEADLAIVESRLITPRETVVLGITVRRDEERSTHYLYKGESFRVGGVYYKVNWVSASPPEIAVARYRAPNPGVPLKFELD